MSLLGNQVFYADQGLNNGNFGDGNNETISMHDAEIKFMHFIQETQERNVFIYRYQICTLTRQF